MTARKPAPSTDPAYERCSYVLVSSPLDGQLTCERPAGHKGKHRLSREDEQESSRMWARWMQKAIARGGVTVPARSVFAEPLDQVRAYIKLRRITRARSEALAALDLIEQRAKEMKAERHRLQHLIDCADTPLMRDVLAERDAAEQRAADMEKALREIEKFGGKAWFDAQETARAALYAARVKLKAEA